MQNSKNPPWVFVCKNPPKNPKTRVIGFLLITTLIITEGKNVNLTGKKISRRQSETMAVIDIGNGKQALETALLKMSRICGLRTSRNPLNRQFSHYR